MAQSVIDSLVKVAPCMKIGEKAPVFTAVNQNGGIVSMNKYRGKKNVLLMFYSEQIYSHPSSPLQSEGQAQIRELVNAAGNLKSRDIEVIMVTPDSQKDIFDMIEATGAQFSFVHDANHQIMDLYKSSVKIPANHPEVQAMLQNGIKLTKKPTEKEYTLPVPVIYLIGRDGVIKGVFNGAKMDQYRMEIGSEKANIYTWQYISAKLNTKD
ncbi:MAG: redoxin domain-containing protein [Bacteroidia bacterium]|nr:redoxin domain-containing protein [Bacteroidia bacterium]